MITVRTVILSLKCIKFSDQHISPNMQLRLILCWPKHIQI